MTVTKNPTQWYPTGGKGYVLSPGAAFLVDQSGNFLMQNTSNFLNTTPNVVVPKNATVWTPSGA